MWTLRSAALILLACGLFFGFVTPIWAEDTPAGGFHKLACASHPPSSSPWHVKNLYDCKTRELFVPYQLWTGADWDGRKDGPCMHKADNTFSVNDRSLTRISGPKNGEIPKWTQRRWSGSGKRFKGGRCSISPVMKKGSAGCTTAGALDITGTDAASSRGKGWKVGVKRECLSTSLEITHVGLDDKGHLSEIKFKYWSRDRLDHIYRYVPNQGMTNAWKQ